ncbi:unnamed protein product [Rodentolepis nana]|uniref:Fibrous sheath-interacting protein 1 n=1 Tax=Rodentolepis nana TaxID=102285 RepID=A0A0R3TDP2_RODNA|nr:unnamed protein product [Rodentolepis nana]
MARPMSFHTEGLNQERIPDLKVKIKARTKEKQWKLEQRRNTLSDIADWKRIQDLKVQRTQSSTKEKQWTVAISDIRLAPTGQESKPLLSLTSKKGETVDSGTLRTDWPGIEAVARSSNKGETVDSGTLNIPDWPRIEAVAEFNFGQESKPLLSLDYVRTDCLAKHLQRLGVYSQGENGEDPPDSVFKGGNGEDPPDSVSSGGTEKTHLIRCPALETRERFDVQL